MSKSRVINVRLKFFPRKAGSEMDEGQLCEYLSRALEGYDGFRIETVLDGDPLPGLLKAVAPKRVEGA